MADRRAFREKADRKWAAFPPRRDQFGRLLPASAKHRTAAASLVRADLVDGLAADPATTGAARAASGVLAAPECLSATPGSFAPGGRRAGAGPGRRRLPTDVHFWCELLARLGDAGAEDPLADLLFDPDPEQPDDEEITAAAALAAAAFHASLAGAGLGTVPLANPLRVLAFLMCPDPAWHRSLAGSAVDPLPERLVSTTARTRLRSAFSPKREAETWVQTALGLETG
ncbi:hypothetical protein [Nocardiopsis coralliicola]